jgi:phage shock protein A
MLGGTTSSGALPPADASKPSVGTLIDSELDALRKQMGS